MIDKIRRLIDRNTLLSILLMITIFSGNLSNGWRVWVVGILILLRIGFAIKDLWTAVKQPLPTWSEDEIKRWEVIRSKGERQYLLAPAMVVPVFFILYGFLFANWDALSKLSFSRWDLLFDAGYCGFAGLVCWFIYLTRKGMWSLREKTYKALRSASPMSDNSLDHSALYLNMVK
jgi:hypothetical protein